MPVSWAILWSLTVPTCQDCLGDNVSYVVPNQSNINALEHMVLQRLWYDMIWYDMIWYDMIWYDMIWCGVVCCVVVWWYGMVWYMIYRGYPAKRALPCVSMAVGLFWQDTIDMIYDIIWYDIIYDIWYRIISYHMIGYHIIWYDIIWYDIRWYHVIWHDTIWQQQMSFWNICLVKNEFQPLAFPVLHIG